MASIPPTTTYQIEQPDESPCCGAPLDLASPPLGYECRECLETYTLAETQDDDPEPDTCQTVKDDGEVCGRDRPCRYHD